VREAATLRPLRRSELRPCDELRSRGGVHASALVIARSSPPLSVRIRIRLPRCTCEEAGEASARPVNAAEWLGSLRRMPVELVGVERFGFTR
jgi:hypothetical protein